MFFIFKFKKTSPVQIYYNLQNHPTFYSAERLVNLVRRRELFVGLSFYYCMLDRKSLDTVPESDVICRSDLVERLVKIAQSLIQVNNLI